MKTFYVKKTNLVTNVYYYLINLLYNSLYVVNISLNILILLSDSHHDMSHVFLDFLDVMNNLRATVCQFLVMLINLPPQTFFHFISANFKCLQAWKKYVCIFIKMKDLN